MPWLAVGLACGNGDDPSRVEGHAVHETDAAVENRDGARPFVPAPPRVYVAKIKTLLVGLPPTGDELAAVEADESKLGELVDGWMETPHYRTKMIRFFRVAFQQTQLGAADFVDQTYWNIDPNDYSRNLLLQNLVDSFARTAWQIVAEGRPFTETVTTHSFMMTPALLEFYGFLDSYQVDDDRTVHDRFATKNPSQSITVSAASGPIPSRESFNPRSANFLHFYNPDVTKTGRGIEGCNRDPIVFPASSVSLHYALLGSIKGRTNPANHTSYCPQDNGTPAATQFGPTDFSSWRKVTLRRPHPGEQPTPFYDLPALRTAKEMVLTVPRVGFFTTPAFFANWKTNASNQARVTTNQALIVALGAPVDGADATLLDRSPGLDEAHAAPGCIGCHSTLDPMRAIVASTYSWSYHTQDSAPIAAQKGLFAFGGTVRAVSDIGGFASAIASHPRFPAAWAQRLCYSLGSAPCSPDDPEFLRIVAEWKSTGLRWNDLVRALVTSPLITYARRTKTFDDSGEVVAVARKEHLCAALDARLGFGDLCGLDDTFRRTSTGMPGAAAGLPREGYGRGSVAPVLPNRPTLFYRSAAEAICTRAAAHVVDPEVPGIDARRWTSEHPREAIADFVHDVMGLPVSDPRARHASVLLERHFETVLPLQGPTAALRSAFVVACLSPSMLGVGL